jgi:hypothetical protein
MKKAGEGMREEVKFDVLLAPQIFKEEGKGKMSSSTPQMN